MNKKTVAFLTLGCKVNSYETDGMIKLFKDAGYEIREFKEEAGVYIVNTCTVTNIADRKSRQMLHKAKKLNPNALVVAAGCYVDAGKEQLLQDSSIDIVVENNNKKNIVQIVEQYGSETEDIFDQYSKDLCIEATKENTRVYIKIQDGCNQFCSYCIIPYARGRVKSRNKEEILKEVLTVVNNGYKEIVLTGIHLSSYGIDLGENPTKECIGCNEKLLQLITELGEIKGLERIRLGSLEPRIVTEEFVKKLACNKKVCPHFHLSLQSGCDNTLKRMNRKYTANDYYERCELLRKYFDNPAITTDVIVGFPGETEQEYSESKLFLEKVQFAQMHIFKYSKRKGTKAEKMENQVPENIKQNRSSELIKLASDLTKKYERQFIGESEKVLVEEKVLIDNKYYMIGHNEKYLKMAFESNMECINALINVEVVDRLNEEILFCKIID